MPQFTVDDDLAARVWQLARPKPFEILTFSSALRRVLQENSPNHTQRPEYLEEARLRAADLKEAKKSPTPSPTEWVATVPELKGKRGLTSWKAICDLLKIDRAGDSARRKLKNLVKANRMAWPSVPDID